MELDILNILFSTETPLYAKVMSMEKVRVFWKFMPYIWYGIKFKWFKHAHRGHIERDSAHINGVHIYYEIYGQGDPLLLLHGGIGDHKMFMAQIPALAKHFLVIAPDTRAQGASEDGATPLSYSLFASDWMELLEYLGMKQAYIVGWSDGGCTGLALAMQHPEVVKKLVVFGTPYNVTNYFPGMMEQLIKSTDESQVLGRYMRKAYQKVAPHPEQWETLLDKLVRDMYNRDPHFTLKQLGTILSPTLVLHAEKEEYFPVKHSQELAQAIPHAKLVVLPGVTHAAPLENPPLFNRTVIDFLMQSNERK